MPIFSKDGLAAINKKLNENFMKMFTSFPVELTCEQFFMAGIKDEHKAILREAYRITVSTQRPQKLVFFYEGREGHAKISFQLNNADFLIPEYLRAFRKSKLQEGEAATAIVSFAEQQYSLLHEVAAMKACVVYLNNICSDAAQLNAFIPALGKFLVAREDVEKKLKYWQCTFNPNDFYSVEFPKFSRARKRLVSGKVASYIPAVPREIVSLCRDANTLLLRCAVAIEGDEDGGLGSGEKRDVEASIELDTFVQPPSVFRCVPTVAKAMPIVNI